MSFFDWLKPAKNRTDYLHWQAEPGTNPNESIFLFHGHGSDAEQMNSLVLPTPPKGFEAIALRGPILLKDDSRTWVESNLVASMRKPTDLTMHHLDKCLDSIEKKIEEIRPRKKVHLIGYSLGAPIVSGLIFRNQSKYKSAAMCNGIITFEDGDHPNGENGPSCFVSAGLLDPILPLEQIKSQVSRLRGQNWDIDFRGYDAPHVVNQSNRADLMRWLARQK